MIYLCSENGTNCSQQCTNTNGSYYCSCFDGYELLNDNSTCHGLFNLWYTLFVTFIDIDECIDSDCEQNCTNTDGSYICSCHSGYTLDSNGKNCSGMK